MTSGCVVPVAPDFQDPPLQQNYAPVLVSTDPPQTIVTTTTFQVTVSDPNVSDDLYVRWIAEYPPFSSTNSKRLKEDKMLPHSANGMPQQTPDSITVDCLLYPLARLPQHPITALISDQPFFSPQTDPTLDPATLLAGIRKNAGSVEAHWVLSLLCQ
jgi:hypothetical protein